MMYDERWKKQPPNRTTGNSDNRKLDGRFKVKYRTFGNMIVKDSGLQLQMAVSTAYN
jgi:hypothetical protein